MVSPYILYPQLSVTPGSPPTYNVGMAETFSWIPIEGANRPIYARASYITNFPDMSIYLSASEVSIGAVTIKDNNSGLNADVVNIPDYGAGLQVLTQDLESTIDDVTIGDKQGHYADVNPFLSALQVNVTNFNDSANLDAFGRLRVSQPYTLLDTKNIYQKNTFLFDEVLSGTAVAQFSAYDSCVDFKTSAPGDYVIRQTRVRFNYSPGKSNIAMFTGLLHPETNIIKRVGLFQSLTAAPFEPSDGIFLEVNGSGPVFRVVKNQGTYHTHYAPQSAWNYDKLDGSGPSGKTLDITKAILFVIDYQWLAIGRIRFGFEIDGMICYAHYNGHMGELTAPYMTYSNQPVRYEIRQTGAGTGLLRQICSTVITEGGQDNVGREYNVDAGNITVQSGVYTPILGLKLNPNAPNLLNLIKQIDIVNTGNASAHYALFLNPLVAGGSLTFSSVLNSNTMLSAAGNGALTITEGVSGFKLVGGFVAAGQGAQSSPTDSQDIAANIARFGAGIRGDTDSIVLAAKGLGATTTLYGSINLIEKG